MILRKQIITAVFLVLICGIGCGENRAIIVRTRDSSKTLIQILMQPDPDSKNRNHLYAAKYLGKRRDRTAIAVLIQTTIHSDKRVVRQALRSLGNIGQEHPDLRRTIARAIKPFLSDQETRDTAEKALGLWKSKTAGE